MCNNAEKETNEIKKKTFDIYLNINKSRITKYFILYIEKLQEI